MLEVRWTGFPVVILVPCCNVRKRNSASQGSLGRISSACAEAKLDSHPHPAFQPSSPIHLHASEQPIGIASCLLSVHQCQGASTPAPWKLLHGVCLGEQASSDAS